jgi:DNA-binding GntR family transcriptional regulator
VAARKARASASLDEAEAPKSLTDRAYREIEERIVTLRLAPGEVLSEASLAQDLDIGRTPIREALQRLAREGLIVILPRRGILVSEINLRSQLELLTVRRELERLMARLTARRATAAEREAFLRLATDMETAADRDDDVGFMRLDRKLNLLIAKGCRNEYAMRTMGLMAGLSRRFWYRHYKEALDLPACARLHAQLARAIGTGDVEAAAAASDRLMEYIESFTRATLELGRAV